MEDKKKLVGVYIDWENVAKAAQEVRVTYSFRTIRNVMRQFGEIAEAVIFLPPHALTERLVTTLCDAGFEVVACPMMYKDRDAVDEYLRTHVRAKALWSEIEVFIIVSEDADFSKNAPFTSFVKDRGKELQFINPKHDTYRKQFTGSPDTPEERVLSREGTLCKETVESILAQENPATEQQVQMRDLCVRVLAAIGTLTIHEKGLYTSIPALARAVESIIDVTRSMRPYFKPMIAALIEKEIIINREERAGKRLLLNVDHPLVEYQPPT